MARLSDYEWIHSYETAERALDESTSGEILDIGYHTRLEKIMDGMIGVRYENVYVVIYTEGGPITISSGDHRTLATKDRLNRYLPDTVRIVVHNGDWALQFKGGKKVPFVDGMRVYPDEARAVIPYLTSKDDPERRVL